jgi:hypothetical protein
MEKCRFCDNEADVSVGIFTVCKECANRDNWR